MRQARWKLANAPIVAPNGAQSKTDIIVVDGAIETRGARLTAPDGATIIDGGWVTPGLFAAMSSVGMTDIGSSGPGNDVGSETSKTNVSEYAADSFNPRSVHVANVRQHGITHAVIAPRSGSDSIFAGTGAIVSLTGEFDSILVPEAFVMVDLGETGTRRAGGSRAAAMSQFRAAIDDAEGFFKRYTDGPDGGDVLSRQDARAFTRAVKGEIPILIRVNRAAEIMRLIDLKSNNPSIKMILIGAAEAWEVADEIAAANIRVVTLPQHAGAAVVEGLQWKEAFRAISSIPARWFGVSEKSVVIWDGDPMEITSAPIAMSINGTAQSMTSRQKALRDRYNPLNTDELPHKYR